MPPISALPGRSRTPGRLRLAGLGAVGVVGLSAIGLTATVKGRAAISPVVSERAPAVESAQATPDNAELGPTATSRVEVASSARAEPSAAAPKREHSTPDLTQTDPSLRLPGRGKSYCGPVAVSNSLMWLGEHGFPNLLPEAPTRRARHRDLVRTISTSAFMGTNRWSGTGPPGVLIGVSRYVKRNGYKIKRLRYQGWRGHQKVYSTGVRRPELSFIASGLNANSAAWLHVGWYRRVPRTRASYIRSGGHWLTVVARTGEREFLLHDPAPYAGESESERVTFNQISEGWLLAEGGRVSFKGRGYYRIEGGMHVKREGETAILDGVVVLEIER